MTRRRKPNPISSTSLFIAKPRPNDGLFFALRKTSENRRTLLAEKGFLSSSRNEMTTDGKSFVSGLFKMLHSDGSHPGLSNEDHSTFRLHLVLVTSRTVLRRLYFKH